MQPQSMPTFSDADSLVDLPLSVVRDDGEDEIEPEPESSDQEPKEEGDTDEILTDDGGEDSEEELELDDEGSEIEIPPISDEDLMAEAGVEQVFSTAEAAEFFDKTNQWLYWGMRPDRKTGEINFTYEDGTPIRPERGDDEVRGRRRFTLPIIRDILMSSYRRGNVEPEELRKILRRIYIARQGGEWRRYEGWHFVDLGRNRRRWVHPDRCEFVDGRWVKKPDA